jgi:hypothetical protein
LPGRLGDPCLVDAHVRRVEQHLFCMS